MCGVLASQAAVHLCGSTPCAAVQRIGACRRVHAQLQPLGFTCNARFVVYMHYREYARPYYRPMRSRVCIADTRTCRRLGALRVHMR